MQMDAATFMNPIESLEEKKNRPFTDGLSKTTGIIRQFSNNKSKIIKMKKFRKVFVSIIALFVSGFAFVSCIKSDPAPLQGVVDVFVQSKKTNDVVQYGVVVYATSNYDIKSAKVTGPGTNGKVYNLTATTYKQQFVYLTSDADYTSELPAKGDYKYEIISTGDATISGTEAVGDEKLDPIVIKAATTANHQLKITWDKLQNAGAYAVKFYSEDKSQLLFASNFITSDKTEFEFGASTTGWAAGKTPVANTNYLVELVGFRFETGVTVNKADNIQFVTLDSKTIKWE